MNHRHKHSERWSDPEALNRRKKKQQNLCNFSFFKVNSFFWRSLKFLAYHSIKMHDFYQHACFNFKKLMPIQRVILFIWNKAALLGFPWRKANIHFYISINILIPFLNFHPQNKCQTIGILKSPANIRAKKYRFESISECWAWVAKGSFIFSSTESPLISSCRDKLSEIVFLNP